MPRNSLRRLRPRKGQGSGRVPVTDPGLLLGVLAFSGFCLASAPGTGQLWPCSQTQPATARDSPRGVPAWAVRSSGCLLHSDAEGVGGAQTSAAAPPI